MTDDKYLLALISEGDRDAFDRFFRKWYSGLPEEQRAAFEKSRSTGLKYEEIARDGGVSVKTVEYRTSKALKALQLALADWIYVVPFLLLLSACTTEIDLSPSGDCFEASVEEGSKTYIDQDFNVRWNAGDKVSIFDSGKRNAEYVFTGSDGDMSGTLSRSCDGSAGEGPYTAVYPYRSTTSLTTDGKISLGVQSKQTFASGSFGPGAAAMVAVSSDRNLQFRNVFGALVLDFTGGSEAVSSITLQGNDGEVLAGTALITMTNGIPSAQFASGGASNSLKLTCDTPVSLSDSPTAFWFALLPLNFQIA